MLLLLAFIPLFTGKNFLPFAHYPEWGAVHAVASGKPAMGDLDVQARSRAMAWANDRDFSVLSLFWPQDLYTSTSLREGRLPLWDPYTGCGAPTLDAGAFRPFNPLRWPFFLFPTNTMYCATLLLGLLLGLWGAFHWLREEGMEAWAAALGAGVFTLNPWSLERLTLLDSAAYYFLPWAILGLRKARWDNPPSVVLAAFPFILMGHAGHPESCLIFSVIAVVVGRFTVRAGGGHRSLQAEDFQILATSGALALGALAALWVPLLRMYASSFSYKEGTLFFLPGYEWKAYLTPSSDLFLAPALAGLLVAALFGSPRRLRAWFLVTSAAGAFIMPLPGLGFEHVRLFQHYIFALPMSYLKPVFWVGVTFLVASGAEALARRIPRTQWAGAAAGVAAFLGSLWIQSRCSLPPGQQTAFASLAWCMLGLQVVSLPILATIRDSGVTKIGLLLLTLLPFSFPLSRNHLAWNDLPAVPGGPPAVEGIRKAFPHERTISIAHHPSFVIPPNQGQIFRVRTVEQNAAVFANAYFGLFYRPPNPPTCIYFSEPLTWLFRHMGARLILLPSELPVPEATLVYRESWGVAYAIEGSHGRAYFARKVRPLDPSEKIGLQIQSLGGGSDDVALVEAMGNPSPPSWPEATGNPPEPSFQTDEPHEVVLRIQPKERALLVLRDTWFQGWEALVDGRRIPIYRVNGCFRGVMVPAGSREVRFLYRPHLVYAAMALSGVVLLGMALFLLAAFRTRSPVGNP